MLSARYHVYFDDKRASRNMLDRIETVTVRQGLEAVWEADVEVPICARTDGEWADADEDFMKAFKRLRIEVQVGDGDFVPIFEGPLVGFDSRMSSQPGQSAIHLRGFDDSILLTRKRPDDQSWAGKVASDIAKLIYGEIATIDASQMLIDPTNETLDDRSEVMPRANLLDTLVYLGDLAHRLIYVAPGAEPRKCIAAFKKRTAEDSELPPLVLLGAGRNIEAFEVSGDVVVASTVVGATLSIDDKAIVERTASYRDEDLMGDEPPIDQDQEAQRLLDPYASSSPYLDDAVEGERSDSAHVLRGHARVRGGCYSGVLMPDVRVLVEGTSEKLAGSYYITSVTHTLTRSEYTQDFEVERAGVSPPAAKAGPVPELS